MNTQTKLRFLLVTALMMISVVTSAQNIPVNVMQMANAELRKRGLNEAEVRERLLREGINVDAIRPAEYAQYQERVTAILDEMETEKKTGSVSPTTKQVQGSTDYSQSNDPNYSSEGVPSTWKSTRQETTQPGWNVLPQQGAQQSGTSTRSGNTTRTESQQSVQPRTSTTRAKTMAQLKKEAEARKQGVKLPLEDMIEDSLLVEKIDSSRWKTRIYGHDLFSNKTFKVISATDAKQVPDSYILGEGDVIHIAIFGASQTDIQQRIAPDGSIKPSASSRIFLKGLSLAQARNVIKESLSRSYLFRDDQFAVSVVTARTVLVNVLGETTQTGGFYLSAVNSALNALNAAGGPSEIGTVRNIQLIRGNNRRIIDLYEFMNDPVVFYRMDLQNNDIIYVPPINNVVLIQGAVKRPMRYEMLEKETLADLVRYSGGLAMNANPDYVQIQRYTAGEEKLFEWNLSDVMTGIVKVDLRDGDIVRILSVKQPVENFVEVEGSVHFPGKFDLQANVTLGTVLDKARMNSKARTDLVFIERTLADKTVEMMSVSLAEGSDGRQVRLAPKDKIRVMELSEFGRSDTVFVNGEVNRPFRRVLSVNNRLTVNEAVNFAGGLKLNVFPVAYIFRKNLTNPQKMNYLRIDLTKDGETLLQPGDSLNIYDNSTYSTIGQLSISGAVKRPNIFTYDQSLTLKDMIMNSGGFNVGAAYNRIEVFRVVLSQTERTRLHMITLQLDSAYNLISPANFSLQPYDHVVVRMTPDFTLGRTMEINGQVRYPGIYVLESRETTLSDVVQMAGGLLEDADPYGAQLFRTYKNRGNVIVQLNKAMRRGAKLTYNPIMFEGDVLNINRMENTVTIMSEGTRIAQYSPDPEAEDSMKVVIYQGGKSAAWYVRNFAGGFQKNVDRKSVSVTYANNQMQSTKNILFFKKYPRVEPGSVITMKMDEEKIEKQSKPRDPGKFESTLSTSLSTLMSTLSIILLLRQLSN